MQHARWRHVVRYYGSVAAVFVGWWSLLADSAGPQFKREVSQTYGDVAITIDSTAEPLSYDCYPVATFNPGVYRAALTDKDGTLLAEMNCLSRTDCLSQVAFDGYAVENVYTCNSSEWEPEDTDTSTDTCYNCTGDSATDSAFVTVECALYGPDGTPNPYPAFTWRSRYSDLCYVDDAQEYTLTVERSDGAISRIEYTQAKQESSGYCSL
jgi:hypothetical protein